MTGLRDLRVPAGATWETAAGFVPSVDDDYSIAADCLWGEADQAAILEAVGDELRPLTYAELDDRTARLAGHLVERGIAPGHRVGVKLSQSADMAVAVLGTLRAGAVVLPLSNVLAEPALRHRVHDAAPRLVVAAGTEAEVALFGELGVPLLAADPSSTAPALTAALASAPASTPPPIRSADPALLLYTSGTTGKSKGVLQAQRFLLGHHSVDLAFDRVRADDVAYTPVDWTWAGGLLLGLLVPLAHGLTVVAHREAHFDAAKTLDLIRRTGVSIGLFPPTVLRMLRAAGIIDAEAVRQTRLRCLITGAEAVEADLIRWGDEIGVTINNAYGQTEANAVVGHAASLGILDPASMGRPYPGHRVAVLDEDLAPVGVGTPGELAVAADDPVCMLRYWRNDEATAAKVRNGWLLTGDTVEWNDDGTLRFRGRGDDIIKSGGYRLGPAEIESAVLGVAGVAECAVLGLPDPIRGQVVTAVVTLHEGAVDDEGLHDAIRSAVRRSVGAHANPRVIRVVEHLPRTTTNKIDRAALRAAMAEAASA